MGQKDLRFLCPPNLGQEMAWSQILCNYHPRSVASWHTWPGEPDWLCFWRMATKDVFPTSGTFGPDIPRILP